ncbi:MAG: hypothetical protein K5883_08730 [Pseudobutyrivibrio sp.]|nr:hypothetical protein [Pseudobutyrivibrio sp.]
MRSRIKTFFIILTIMLLVGNIFPATAFAANETIVTGIRFEEIDAPVAGQPLDSIATIATDQGITWDIPVIWVDKSGAAASIAKEGQSYLPVFAFYVPGGYKVKTDSTGAFSIVLPEYLQKLLGSDQLLFALDDTTGITYITYNPETTNNNLYSYHPENKETNSSSHDENNNTETPPRELTQVEIHCAVNTIDNIGFDNLNWFVSLIKNTIEPRAVALLIDSFPAYKTAADNGELGKSIGLYVYDSRFEEENDKNPSGSLAYVEPAFNDAKLCYFIGLNTFRVFVQTEEEDYIFNEAGMGELENTIVHELMHAFMFDYTRTGWITANGWYNPEHTEMPNSFPPWFEEGIATAVENGYQYRENEYGYFKNDETNSYIYDGLIEWYSIPQNKINYYQTSYKDAVYSAYSGGYLALVYLGAYVNAEQGEIIDGTTITSEQVRNGVNQILEWLHEGKSLDEIIRDETNYSGLQEFEEKFLTEPADENDPDDENDPGASAQFATDFLNQLNSYSDNETGEIANGSILYDFSKTSESPLEGRTEDSSNQEAYFIENTQEHVASTVNDDVATSSAGSYHTWDESDDWMEDDAEEQAAKNDNMEDMENESTNDIESISEVEEETTELEDAS